MLGRAAAGLAGAFGMFAVLCVISIVAFPAGALFGLLAISCSAVAMTERPSRGVRRAALFGVITGSLALLGSAVFTAMWVIGT